MLSAWLAPVAGAGWSYFANLVLGENQYNGFLTPMSHQIVLLMLSIDWMGCCLCCLAIVARCIVNAWPLGPGVVAVPGHWGQVQCHVTHTSSLPLTGNLMFFHTFNTFPVSQIRVTSLCELCPYWDAFCPFHCPNCHLFIPLFTHLFLYSFLNLALNNEKVKQQLW